MKFQYTLNVMISVVIKHFRRVRHPSSARTRFREDPAPLAVSGTCVVYYIIRAQNFGP